MPSGELAEITVWREAAGRYRLTGAQTAAGVPGEWLLEARAAHLHHDVGAAFGRVLPPRPVPWKNRLMWALVLRLAASRPGLALLATLRRRV
jgi:hypothetical protein